MSDNIQRWFPSKNQLSTPEGLERAFRQALEQHYSLVDRTSVLELPQKNTTSSGPPPGSGPTDTQLLGLRVVPIDTQTLADGATLKWDKKNGNFHFV